MMLTHSEQRQPANSLVVPRKLAFHPAEVRQLQTRADELVEEISQSSDGLLVVTIASEVARLRSLLQECAEGQISVTRRAGLAA